VLGRSPSSVAGYARDLVSSLPAAWRGLITQPRKLIVPAPPLMHFPFVGAETPAAADLLRVNDLVPRGFPEHMRADICQSIMLALYEGTVTLAEIEANRDRLSWFVKRWRGEQQPYLEMQVAPGDDDARPYHDIAAALRQESRAAEVNDARRALAAWADRAEPTQLDDVYRSEVGAARLLRQLQGADVRSAKRDLDSGRLRIGTLPRTLFGQFAGISGHAKKRLRERWGVELDAVGARAILAYCRGRRPEFSDADAETHLLRTPRGTMFLVYHRPADIVKTVYKKETRADGEAGPRAGRHL